MKHPSSSQEGLAVRVRAKRDADFSRKRDYRALSHPHPKPSPEEKGLYVCFDNASSNACPLGLPNPVHASQPGPA
jgi:hypothetical protein